MCSIDTLHLRPPCSIHPGPPGDSTSDRRRVLAARRNKNRLGEVLAFRSLVAWLQRDIRGSFSLARQALELLPEGEIQWRGISLLFAGGEELFSGRLNNARQTLTKALAILESAENIFAILDSSLLLCEVYFQ